MNEEIQLILNAILKIKEDVSLDLDVPIFSFEGLPGAGKSTQIIEVVNSLSESNRWNAYYVDLPSSSSIGLMLRSLYMNKDGWTEVCNKYPWLNVLFISIDLILNIQKAKENNADFIIMSRGIISTYYYNLTNFLNYYNNEDMAWSKLNELMTIFPIPKSIFIIDVPPEVAYQRVVKRARGELRPMDHIENMRLDKVMLNTIIERLSLSSIVHVIDGDDEKHIVTKRLISLISGIMYND